MCKTNSNTIFSIIRSTPQNRDSHKYNAVSHIGSTPQSLGTDIIRLFPPVTTKRGPRRVANQNKVSDTPGRSAFGFGVRFRAAIPRGSTTSLRLFIACARPRQKTAGRSSWTRRIRLRFRCACHSSPWHRCAKKLESRIYCPSGLYSPPDTDSRTSSSHEILSQVCFCRHVELTRSLQFNRYSFGG
jgi:hypothetical protein